MLAERLKSALPLIAIVAVVFFAPMGIGGALFALLAAAMLCLACSETFALLAPPHSRRLLLIVTVTGLLMSLLAALPWLASLTACGETRHLLEQAQELGHLLPAAALLLAFLLSFRETPTREQVNAILIAAGAGLFICWQLHYFVRIFYHVGNGEPRFLLLYLIAVTKMADVGAFAAGTLCARRPGGNHHLAPLISPKKSWEGLVGGTVLSLATSLALVACCGDRLALTAGQPLIGWGGAILIGVAASPIGLLGDLAESAIKRAANAKDSGSLPGIGGILDVLDSLLPMGPLFYAYLRLAAA